MELKSKCFFTHSHIVEKTHSSYSLLGSMSYSKLVKLCSLCEALCDYVFKKTNFRRLLILGLLLTIFFTSQAQTKFTNITESAGINHQFAVKDGFLGGGVCVLDVNNDGFQDLFITGGKLPDRLYLNQKDGTFKDILASAGIAKITKEFVTQGVASADVNRDGLSLIHI